MIDTEGDLNLRETLQQYSGESLDTAQHAAFAAYLHAQDNGVVASVDPEMLPAEVAAYEGRENSDVEMNVQIHDEARTMLK